MAERHVVVDPYVLAVPGDAKNVASYIEGLLTWLPVLTKRREECSCFQSALPVLLEENRFPTRSTLAPLLAMHPSQEFSLNDLLQMVRVVAANEPFFEEFVERRAVAATNLTVTPAAVLARLGNRLGAVTGDALALTAVAQDSGWCSERTYWATSTWEDAAEWIETQADVSIVELLDGNIEAIDRSVTGRLRVLTATDEVEFGTSVVDSYADPAAAAAIVLYRLRQFDDTLPDQIDVRGGPNFVTSLETHGIQTRAAILETVFERAALAAVGRLQTISGAKLHPVRTSQAANAPQVERADGAKLWRCMVTKTGAGYRLHYWSLVGGAVELDEVVVESDT